MFSLAVFPFAVGVNIDSQIKYKKKEILETRIAENDVREKDFWSKHTFYGKIVTDATGEVIDEWKRKDGFFQPKVMDKE